MAKTTAGILLYRYSNGMPEFFLVHPGGPFWSKKDIGAWSVPKGELNENEDVLLAAKREFEEETSIKVDGEFIALKAAKGSNGKTIRIFALQHDVDPSLVKSNLFSMEWPAKSGKFREFPEVDRGKWFSFEEAVVKINKHQVQVLQELREKIDLQI
ncbi:NUDIX domain-containing protein [Ohtaekwangia kribbensis]|jgi:predicted NUDIX family NTP pyrophosphohydrolase|uniref:NUDIX domain-containing protein n=1 Tax=Ohtaekwangia kribbensis TaxID=688913 RepID=A0ABW3KDT8_9BACT